MLLYHPPFFFYLEKLKKKAKDKGTISYYVISFVMVMFLYRTVQFPKRSYGPHTVCNYAPKLFFFSSLPVISFGLIFFLDGWISFIRISPLYLFLPPFF
jgi:hypothetical protein